MARINLYIETSLFNQLKELPGTLSEHVRIAIREYLARIKEFNASASQSKRKEGDSNE
mgnify:CR=1 FL=1